MKMQLSCGCCDSREFCQRNYNPKTGDCGSSWYVNVTGSHTPGDQRDSLSFIAGGIPVAGDDLPWGVRDFGGGGGGGFNGSGFENPEHTEIVLTPQTDTFNDLLPIGFGETNQSACVKTRTISKTLSTGLVPDPKGSTPPENYTVTWSNVSMAQPRFRYDTFRNLSVGTGESGLGSPSTVQIFSNAAAGFMQTDPFAAQMSWGQYDKWPLNIAQSFSGELWDAAGGANNYIQWNAALTRAVIIDPTTVEYAQSLSSERTLGFVNGVVSASYSANSRAIARARRHVYNSDLLVVQTAEQGVFTGPDGTTVAKLLSIGPNNFWLGNTHDGRQIWLHPLLTALGVPIPTAPIILTFAVKIAVRPTVEALYTFDDLDGEAVPDGWNSVASYPNKTFNGLLYSVGTVTQDWHRDQISALIGIASNPTYGSIGLPTDSSSWEGEPADQAKWKDRNGFSFDIDSEDTDDVLTVTRNDCPIPPDLDPVDPEEETAP